MPDIHIQRTHRLGLPEARKIAGLWAQKAQAKFDMECAYEEGAAQDTLRFQRPGIEGTLQVHADRFELQAELGFLFSAFKDRIAAEIDGQFDKLLGRPSPSAA